LSDPVDEAFQKYLKAPRETDINDKIECPDCKSKNVDRGAGYRGEYRCKDCGHYWQVGGWQST
jgi:transposase-like protein